MSNSYRSNGDHVFGFNAEARSSPHAINLCNLPAGWAERSHWLRDGSGVRHRCLLGDIGFALTRPDHSEGISAINILGRRMKDLDNETA